MKKVILTTILFLSLLSPATSLAADSQSLQREVAVTVPARMELDVGVLAALNASIPLGEKRDIITEVKLRSNTPWFVKTTTLTSLQEQIQNDTVFSGQSNQDETQQSLQAGMTQVASWSDDKKEEALVIYALSPGF